MRSKKLISFVGLSAVLCMAPLAVAQDQGPRFYVGASWGAYSVDRSNLDENDDVLKALVGVQFSDWFGVEASIADFNRVNSGGDNFEGDGQGVAAVISMPVLTMSSFFVKGGQFWWDSKSSLGGVLGSSDGNDPFWGVGFKLGFNEHLALRIEAERYKVFNADIDVASVGVDFQF
jgi:hypothetical protein